MDSWNNSQNNNQEPDMSVSGQFSGNPYQDQNTAGDYGQPQDNTANNYGQPQDNMANNYGQPQNNTTNNYSQPQGEANGYGQPQNMAGGYNQPQNITGGYNQPQSTTGNYNQSQNAAGGYGYNQQGQNNYAYGQPYANYNQSPYQGPGYTPTEMEEPVGMGEWIGLLLLATFVPCIGLILMLVWAFGSTEKKSKSNFCKAYLIICLIKLALYAILFIVWGASFAAAINSF